MEKNNNEDEEMNKSRLWGTATMNMVYYIKTLVKIHVLYLLHYKNTLLQINNSAKSQKITNMARTWLIII